VFESDGAYVRAWGGGGTSPGELLQPLGIALDRRGDVYVVDQLNWRIQKFAPGSTTPVLVWGEPGTGAGKFDRPTAIALDAGGSAFVADAAGHRILKFGGVVELAPVSWTDVKTRYR
jgi:DNA-binding beta-propeller fold protein YncE